MWGRFCGVLYKKYKNNDVFMLKLHLKNVSVYNQISVGIKGREMCSC